MLLFEKEKVPGPEKKELSFAEVLKDYQFSIRSQEGKEVVISFTEEEFKQLKEYTTGGYLSETLKRVIPERFQVNIENLELTPEQWKEACLQQPSLFSQLPETIHTKFILYNNLAEEKEEAIRDKVLRIPVLLTLGPERIIYFYLISKLGGEKGIRINHLLSNPDTFARKHLSEKDYEQFKVLSDYFKPLLEKRRKIRRRIGDRISKDQKEETEEKLQKIGPEFERKKPLAI